MRGSPSTTCVSVGSVVKYGGSEEREGGRDQGERERKREREREEGGE